MVRGLGARYRDYRLAKMGRIAEELNQRPGRLGPAACSPPVSLPNKLKITLGTLPVQLAIAKEVERSMTSVRDNPESPRTAADAGFLTSFEFLARSKGIARVGYTEIPREFVFLGRSIPYSHAIVLVSEIPKGPTDRAPSPETQAIGLITYDELGKATGSLVDHLRKDGFSAEAGHPAIGPVLYPRLAMKAGLGWSGRHGMLITPEFGPRQRISAIFTSIGNLAPTDSSEHEWIRGFCSTCGNCVRKCPAGAIYEKPVEHPDGRLSHIDGDKCISCTVCMKECSFNKRGYESVRSAFLARGPDA
jgi:epoxyqueuosine reductase